MFNFFKKKPIAESSQLSAISWQLSGMHCTSCAVDIDLTLEDIKGVSESKTNYARSTIIIQYDRALVDKSKIRKEIEKLGYTVS
ncbi:heavy-metal-associated domain-containing protein [Candidatus Curtissbacteria bacterium]|nr:heavy-metal-associated domain-containing protein [Candidatus Curtissbacteria bacterium]